MPTEQLFISDVYHCKLDCWGSGKWAFFTIFNENHNYLPSSYMYIQLINIILSALVYSTNCFSSILCVLSKAYEHCSDPGGCRELSVEALIIRKIGYPDGYRIIQCNLHTVSGKSLWWGVVHLIFYFFCKLPIRQDTTEFIFIF